MAKSRITNRYVADFETTTNENDCRVWLWGLYGLHDHSFRHGNSINSFFDGLKNFPDKSIVYFHNLKFDGEFLFYYLFEHGFSYSSKKHLNDYEFNSLISDMGVFYSIKIQFEGKSITIYDSLKTIPLPVKKISKAFGIEQLKGEIDYTKEREIGYKASVHEVDYVRNDVEIVGKAVTYFFEQNLTKMTQASNALSDYKKLNTYKKFDKLFPNLDSIDDELRQSYKGGFTYVNPKYKNRNVGKGIVFDVNSLYPFVMYSRKLPYGEPIYYVGKYENDKLYDVYIQMVRCNFELKENHIPTIQLKHNYKFMPTEYVSSSNGEDVTMCLTSVDLELFLEHYNVYNLEYFCGWKFKSSDTLFKSYIDKWTAIKERASKDGNEGLRTIAKLMMNALYGKFGLNPKVRSKIPWYDGEMVHYSFGDQETRDTIYLPIASFVTSYARQITITSAQKNYDRFMYADTDSLHLDGEEIPANINVDPVKLGFWKHEGNFNQAKFIRAKSYIENMYIPQLEYDKLNDEKKKSWNYNEMAGVYEQLHVACAGLPVSCHDKITFENFHDGTKIPGKLQHKRVKGGVILKEIDFTIKL